jgi:hypothetical protein
MSSGGKLSHLGFFLILVLYYKAAKNYLRVLLFVSFVKCSTYCPLLFVFIYCAVSIMGHLAVESAH